MEDIALILAAGFGSRMLPMSNTVPKPLIPVCGQPMIESIIEMLLQKKLKKIYIVIGYLKEKFYYLKEKYPIVDFIINDEYETRNNISSFYAARDVLAGHNCYICEADLRVWHKEILLSLPPTTFYCGYFVKGYSDDWLFDLDAQKKVTLIHKGGTNRFNMIGISYFLQQDMEKVLKVLEDKYTLPEWKDAFWDELVNEVLDEITVKILEISKDDILEIDSLTELAAIDESYKKE